jgi:hypothetical protein
VHGCSIDVVRIAELNDGVCCSWFYIQIVSCLYSCVNGCSADFFSIGHISIGILAQKLKLELIQMLNQQVNYHVSILDPQS